MNSPSNTKKTVLGFLGAGVATIVAVVATVTTLTSGTINTTNITSTNSTGTHAVLTNLSSTNALATNSTSTNSFSTNSTSTYFSATNATITTGSFPTLNATNTSINAQDANDRIDGIFFTTQSIDPQSIAVGQTTTTVFTVPGASVGDTVLIDTPGLYGTSSTVSLRGYVSASGFVTGVWINTTTTARDLGGSAINVTVISH
jgi:hypothetical protein